MATEGFKTDAGKNRVDLLPVRPIEQVAMVMTDALKKYPERNWEQGMSWSRLYGAALRHLFAWWKGEDKDPDSGISHLAHAACNILFLIEYLETKPMLDDRPIKKKE